MDLVRIAAGAAAECVRQQADTITDVRNLLNAYQYAITVRDNGIQVNETTFRTLGGLVEPVKNATGFRVTPVTFQNGGSSAPASEITRLMIGLRDGIKATEYQRNETEINHLTREFLWIHPFQDGNGRLGWILYNFLRGSLDEPVALPHYQW